MTRSNIGADSRLTALWMLHNAKESALKHARCMDETKSRILAALISSDDDALAHAAGDYHTAYGNYGVSIENVRRCAAEIDERWGGAPYEVPAEELEKRAVLNF